MQVTQTQTEGFEISPQQARLRQIGKGNSDDFRVFAKVKIIGNLDVNALENALARVCEKYEILRTGFQSERQFITEKFPQIGYFDLSGSNKSEIERLFDEIKTAPFDLENAETSRFCLAKKSSDEYHLILAISAYCADAGTIEILIKELFDFYENPSHKSDKPLQYADLSRWQLDLLEDDNEAANYWRKLLNEADVEKDLPLVKRGFSQQKLKFEKHQISLESFFSAEITAYLNEQKILPESFWLACWNVLLSRLSGNEKFLLGVKSTGREFEDLRSAVGNLTKFLPFVCPLGFDESFLENFPKIEDNLREGRERHEFFTADKSVSELPHYGFSFSEKREKISLTNAEIEIEEVSETLENFKLSLAVQPNEVLFQYQPEFFSKAEIERFGERLLTVVRQIIELKNSVVNRLKLVGNREREMICRDFNRTQIEFPSKFLHEMFTETAAEFPQKIAIETDERKLTYRELDEESNRLANFLISRGIGAEESVGICGDRSIEMIVGVLAILKSGAAFVPLAADLPRERLEFLTADARVNLLLINQNSAEVFEEIKAEKILLDDENSDWKQVPANLPARKIFSENPAYIIYTSGTTGKPKGVSVSHRAIVNHLQWRQKEFGFSPDDSFLQKAALSFDIAVWEIFTPLTTGGKLILARPEGHRDFEYLARTIAEKEITFAHFSPFQLRRFLSENVQNCRALKKVFVGGERLTAELKDEFYRKLDAELIQQYGPTETTVDVTFWRCAAENSIALPIGKPIANTQAFVLDKNLQILPFGTVGELYIGGAALARGYIGKPDLTAEKFIPNPFSADGERLYRTGDAAYFDTDGNLYFAGRFDRQVKVRGYRIELGEVETALHEFSGVGEAVAVVFDESKNEPKIAAYFTAERTMESSQLRDFLRLKLPEYAVPAVFIQVDEIPLTRHAKIDFTALPAPQSFYARTNRKIVAPRNELENLLAKIWREVLSKEEIGVSENFFDLGGDSIRSVQVAAKIKKSGWQIELQDLFKYQTIEQLAAVLKPLEENVVESTEKFALVSKKERAKLPQNLADAYPLTLLQAGMLFHGELETDSDLYHNVAGVHLRMPFSEKKLRRAINILTAKHAVLRTSFDLHNYSEPLQLVHEHAEIPLEIFDLREFDEKKQEEQLEKWVENEKKRKFDWTQPPLIRFTVHRRNEESFQFSRTEHHAILDGWSVASMLTELFKVYRGLLNGEEISAFDINAETSFREFVRLEKEAVNSEKQISFWQEFLVDSTVSRVPRLPSFLENTSARRGKITPIEVSDEISEKLKETSAALGVQVKHILLAAHLRVLVLLSGQTDVVSGLIANGRPEETGSENILGLFLNTLPFRQKLKNGESWQELIKKTFAIESEMLPFRRFPLAELQRLTGEQIFEAAFNFVSFHVYESIYRNDAAQVLSEQSFQETNFVFLATASVNPQTGKINFRLEYDAAQFTEPQIENIRGYYAKALNFIAYHGSENYLEADLLGEAERNLVVKKWNDTAAVYSPISTMHGLFEAQTARTPDKFAAIFGAQQMTYRELNEEANRIAHALLNLGLRRGELVGVHLKRSMEMIPALLAILKIGCAYVPLEVTNPRERIRSLIAHHKIRTLLTQSERISLLLDESEMLDELEFVVCLDELQKNEETNSNVFVKIIEQSDFENLSAENPNREVNSEDLAYIIFTSGSTGMPKGVMVAHQPVINLIEWITKTHGVSENDRVLFITSLSFDLSVYDIFGLLAVGGSIRIASAEEIAEPAELYRILRDEPITFWDSAPAAMQQIVPFFESSCEETPTLRLVYFSGDWIPVTLPDNVRRAFPNAEVIALGGATEATVWSNFYPVGEVDSRWASIPYGKPIQNAEYRVLDERLHPAPIGTVGDLYIGGECLAMGYLDEPVLTATKFIPDPFASKKGAIMYRTGDQARFFPDGNIEFMGRIDHQVKVRGYRIELGEIEAALLKVPQIRQAIVLAQINERKEKFLAAFVVFKTADEQISDDNLRQILRETLPEYMIPAVFVFLPEIPVTANGKIDRKSLTIPNEKTEKRVFDAPQTETEKIVGEIWAEVLGVDEISRQDDFFMLGGHSLVATQVISRIREAFDLDLPLRTLFEMTMLEKLAVEIDSRLIKAKRE